MRNTLRTSVLGLLLGCLMLAAHAQTSPPTWHVQMALVRYDEPLGYSSGYGRTRQLVQRRPGPDATDWPQITLNGRPVFQNGPSDTMDLPLRVKPQNAPLLQQTTDDVLQPGNHWLRPLEWIWGQHFIYTADRTARGWDKDYELWTFPVKISGTGDAPIRSVVLTVGHSVIYTRTEPLHSLTLLLPQNVPDQPYLLSINGKASVMLQVGLKPVQEGNPQDVPLPVQVTLANDTLTVSNADCPPEFFYTREWQADEAALQGPLPTEPSPLPMPLGFLHHLGIDVPCSPVSIHASGLPSGMSGGYLFQNQFPGTLSDYADLLSETGYDAAFEQTEVNGLTDPSAERSYDRWAQDLAQKGIGTILVPDITFLRPFTNSPNLAFESAYLPDFHAPVYRDLQLEAQRLARYGNFQGVSIGADNAGYTPYWDWAPPNPNRPWAEAYLQFQQGRSPITPVGGDNTPRRGYEMKSAARSFVDYLARYDRTWDQYGYFARAVTTLSPTFSATTGSFGSSPGVGGRGGWPWASLPGELLYRQVPVQQAYDWNEQLSTLPMHLEALLDRLRSADPHKPTWAVVDDFKYHLTRLSRQRAYALALTRGVQAIGPTYLAHTTGPDARPQTVAEQRTLYAWIHKYGGAYAMTRTAAPLGILYVQTQALMRSVLVGEYPDDATILHGSHEGKTTETLFLCHAAGWPARLVTSDELKRGLPPEMRTLLLVGLNSFDNSWHWYDGLTPALKSFVAHGGRILRDAESVCPISSTATGMQVRAYVVNRDRDWTPELFARNADNIVRLQQALRGTPVPVVQSTEPTVWAIPTQAGSTQYVTVVNQGFTAGKDAGQFVRPQTATLRWHTSRLIYDVRKGRHITPAEAATCDLTQDAFRWYALLPAPPTQPKVVVMQGSDGFYHADITIGKAKPMTGIPVQLSLSHAGKQATIYSATGLTPRLPLTATDAPGPYILTVTELLSGLSSQIMVTVPPQPAPSGPSLVTLTRPEAIRQFAGRRAIPLTIALTPDQASDSALMSLANALATHYRNQGRTVHVGSAAPSDVVLGLQPLRFPMRYPQWRTINSDLILFGLPSDNILLFDQARALLLPNTLASLERGHAILSYVSSPFVGEYDSLNILAGDLTGLKAAVRQLEDASPP